jgi:hypothetical protein
VGPNPFSVNEVRGRVGSFVAKHLFKEITRAFDKPSGQGDLGTGCPVTPERALKSRAGAKANLLPELRNSPKPPPLDD